MRPFSERRKYPRIAETVSCQVSVGPGKSLQTLTKNLSCGGALCSLPEAIAPMTQLEVALDLPPVRGSAAPARQQVHCLGVVIRQDRLPLEEKPTYLTAIYFSDLNPEDRRRIGEFVLQSMFSHDRRRS
jgi:c-di-GMP-binding flagellar brake protein YcgR